jgi:hypothetical protein
MSALDDLLANIRDATMHGRFNDASMSASIGAYRAEVLTEAAAELDRIADTVEARVAEHYGPASGIGPGSAQMLRDAAGNVRYMAGKDTREGESTQPAPYTDAGAAFMQLGRTPSLAGLRAELRIDGQPPIVGTYCGVGMRKPNHRPGLLVEPVLLFTYTDEATAEDTPDRVECAHGYVLGQDSCPGCDAAEEQPHHSDPVRVRTSDGRVLDLCRNCGQPPMRCRRPADGEVARD